MRPRRVPSPSGAATVVSSTVVRSADSGRHPAASPCDLHNTDWTPPRARRGARVRVLIQGGVGVTGPLSGIRVIELGQVIAGPFCGQLLGDYGAEVIKVEPPGTGDVLRQWGHADVSGDSLWWSVAARNKRSVTIDLRTAEGQQLVRDLVAARRHPRRELPAGDAGTLGAGLGRARGRPTRADHGAGQRLRPDRAVRAAGRLRLDRRGDGRSAGADRLPRPAADPDRHQHRRLAHRHVRRAWAPWPRWRRGAAPAAARSSTRASSSRCWR